MNSMVLNGPPKILKAPPLENIEGGLAPPRIFQGGGLFWHCKVSIFKSNFRELLG